MSGCFVVIDLISGQIYGSNAYLDRDEAEAVMENLKERYPKANLITLRLNLKPKRELEEINKEDVGSVEDVLGDLNG